MTIENLYPFISNNTLNPEIMNELKRFQKQEQTKSWYKQNSWQRIEENIWF